MAKVRQLLIGLASSSALYSGLVPALGLGEITLHSALSQPLDAEIELFDVGLLKTCVCAWHRPMFSHAPG